MTSGGKPENLLSPIFIRSSSTTMALSLNLFSFSTYIISKLAKFVKFFLRYFAIIFAATIITISSVKTKMRGDLKMFYVVFKIVGVF